VPATTFAASPAAWSLTMFSQVAPAPRLKYLGLGRAWMVATGTTKRIPSDLAASPQPRQADVGLGVDEGGVGSLDRVQAQVVLLDVMEAVAGEGRG